MTACMSSRRAMLSTRGRCITYCSPPGPLPRGSRNLSSSSDSSLRSATLESGFTLVGQPGSERQLVGRRDHLVTSLCSHRLHRRVGAASQRWSAAQEWLVANAGAPRGPGVVQPDRQGSPWPWCAPQHLLHVFGHLLVTVSAHQHAACITHGQDHRLAGARLRRGGRGGGAGAQPVKEGGLRLPCWHRLQPVSAHAVSGSVGPPPAMRPLPSCPPRFRWLPPPPHPHTHTHPTHPTHPPSPRTACSKRAFAISSPITACPAGMPYLSLMVLATTSLRNLRAERQGGGQRQGGFGAARRQRWREGWGGGAVERSAVQPGFSGGR